MRSARKALGYPTPTYVFLKNDMLSPVAPALPIKDIGIGEPGALGFVDR